MADILGLNGQELYPGKKATLTLEYDMATGKLAVGGETANVDLALNILAQATRWFEARYQMAQAMQMQAEIQRDQQILSMTRQ